MTQSSIECSQPLRAIDRHHGSFGARVGLVRRCSDALGLLEAAGLPGQLDHSRAQAEPVRFVLLGQLRQRWGSRSGWPGRRPAGMRPGRTTAAGSPLPGSRGATGYGAVPTPSSRPRRRAPRRATTARCRRHSRMRPATGRPEPGGHRPEPSPRSQRREDEPTASAGPGRLLARGRD
jgi:hypothetical protein